MRFEEVLETIAASQPCDWNVLHGGGDPDRVQAVMKDDLDVALTWDITPGRDFAEKWAQRFANPHATLGYFHISFRNVRIHSDAFVAVDGARALLPLPISVSDLGVNPTYSAIVRLIGLLGNEARAESYAHYFHRAGLRHAEVRWPTPR